MKTCKTVVLVIGLMVGLYGLTSDAWGGGPAGIGSPSCLVNNPGSGALAIRGTVAVEAQSVANQDTAVDFTWRLERSGAVKFFRHSLPVKVFGLSNEEVACLYLDSAFAGEILGAFAPNRTELVITDKSISNAEIQGDQQQIDFTGRGSTLADITIYAQ